MPLGATVLVRGARTQNAFKKMIQYNADLGQWTVRPDTPLPPTTIVEGVASYKTMHVCNA